MQIANSLKIPHAYLPSIKLMKVRRTRHNRIIQDKIAFLYVFRRRLLSLSLSILDHVNKRIGFQTCSIRSSQISILTAKSELYDVVDKDIRIYIYMTGRVRIIELFRSIAFFPFDSFKDQIVAHK